MKVTLHMAISLNGIIARENNEEDFLSEKNWDSMIKLTHQTKNMIWGRKTHEIIRGWGQKYLDEIRDIKVVVVSSDENFELEENYERAKSPKEAISRLEELGFKETMLIGGSRLDSSFAEEGLINEIVFNIEPVVVGRGIPVFSPQEFDLKLELMENKMINPKLLQLRYKVIK